MIDNIYACKFFYLSNYTDYKEISSPILSANIFKLYALAKTYSLSPLIESPTIVNLAISPTANYIGNTESVSPPTPRFYNY